MKTIFNSDKPISDKTDDRFNRFNFSKRIAETIINRNSEDGLVIGIYGIWGEGKTSILNILEGELKNNENIVLIKFNPWRFTNEENLILNFLKNISEALNKQLNNNIEKLGGFIKKYGGITSLINLDLLKIGESLSDTDLEELKNRVNEFLKESNKKAVIIIDDIDRLDKQELFSIFKLVKLTGDFSNTYYVLAFDNDMVAASIGERYAQGDKNAGYNYLEKIIQVPLIIPKPLSSSILNFTLDLINKVINETGIVLSPIEGQKIGFIFFEHILKRISTPRLAVRFANSLSFLLPLLKGEVNHSDLIVFEAVKIFYPDYYNFIKTNPHFFIDSYDNLGGRRNEEKVKELNVQFEKLGTSLSLQEKKSIKYLLIRLFPRLNEGFNNSYVQDGENLWAKEKNIGSAKYFNRYFLYSVPDNEISDVYFENFINSLKDKSIKNRNKELKDILDLVDSSEFLNKLSYFDENIDSDIRVILIDLLVQNENSFEDIKSVFGASSPKSQLAIKIVQLLKSLKNKEQQFEIALKLFSDVVPFEFSMELYRWFNVGKNESEKIFDEKKFRDLKELLLNRALTKSKNENTTLFEKYDQYAYRLLEIWYELNPKALNNYGNTLISENPNYVKIIIYTLTSTIYSSTNPNPYKVDLKERTFNDISNFFDIELFYKTLIKHYGPEINKEEAIFYDIDEGQNEMNALRQFVFWYSKS